MSATATVRTALPAGWAAFPGGEVESLRARMADTVAPLDHALLNDHLTEPTDENLARWVRSHLATDVPGIVQVGVQSTTHSGVDLDGKQIRKGATAKVKEFVAALGGAAPPNWTRS